MKKKGFFYFKLQTIHAINDQDVISFPSLDSQTLNACFFLPSKFSLFLRPTLEFFLIVLVKVRERALYIYII
jgi:hypothetical protein